MKRCLVCEEMKPLSDFYKKSGRAGVMSECKICWNARNKRWRDAHPGQATEYKRRWRERNSEYARNRHLEARYGVTAEKVDALIEEQEGRCRICNNERPLVVDHDHDTGRFRGLLCQQCNAMLGMVGDDPEVLRRAIDYLEASRAHV